MGKTANSSSIKYETASLLVGNNLTEVCHSATARCGSSSQAFTFLWQQLRLVTAAGCQLSFQQPNLNHRLPIVLSAAIILTTGTCISFSKPGQAWTDSLLAPDAREQQAQYWIYSS